MSMLTINLFYNRFHTWRRRIDLIYYEREMVSALFNCLNMRLVITALLALIFLQACKNSPERITDAADYNRYLKNTAGNSFTSVQNINKDILFWMKRLSVIADDPISRAKLAGL